MQERVCVDAIITEAGCAGKRKRVMEKFNCLQDGRRVAVYSHYVFLMQISSKKDRLLCKKHTFTSHKMWYQDAGRIKAVFLP